MHIARYQDVAASRSSKTLSSTMDTLINLRSEVRQWALETPLEDDLKGSEVTQEGSGELGYVQCRVSPGRFSKVVFQDRFVVSHQNRIESFYL